MFPLSWDPMWHGSGSINSRTAHLVLYCEAIYVTSCRLPLLHNGTVIFELDYSVNCMYSVQNSIPTSPCQLTCGAHHTGTSKSYDDVQWENGANTFFLQGIGRPFHWLNYADLRLGGPCSTIHGRISRVGKYEHMGLCTFQTHRAKATDELKTLCLQILNSIDIAKLYIWVGLQPRVRRWMNAFKFSPCNVENRANLTVQIMQGVDLKISALHIAPEAS